MRGRGKNDKEMEKVINVLRDYRKTVKKEETQ